MKRRLFLLATLFMMVSFMTNAQDRPRWLSDNAIMGKYEIVNQNGSKYYRLYDVHTNGITIGKQQKEYDGHLEDDESIRFSFTDTDIPCDGNVRFYKYNMDIEDWQVDGEIRVGQKSFNTTSSMVVMLILDCSSSMDNDFEEMRRSAKDFVRQLGQNSIGSGNIHMGLICFNSVKFTESHTYDIRPIMDRYDVDYFCNKIDQLIMGNNTAMYYAMDKGYNMIDDYVNGQNLKNYKSACMVTFTDGYDNHSIYKNEKPQSGVNNPYYKHVNDIIRNKTIKNHKVESFVIALKGSDVKEIEQSNPKFSNVFKSVLEGVASDDREFPRKVKHFTLCDNISGVKRVFNEICESLIYSWQVLNCFCAQSHDGWVQWVVECEEVYKPDPNPDPDPLPIVKQKKVRFNLNLGLTTMNVKETYNGQTDKYSLTGEKDASTKGVYLGVSWDMSFKYGLGIEFADLGFAYYRGSKSESYYGESLSIKATSLNAYLSPIKFQYRYETPSSFAVFAATGPALDFCLDYTVKYDYYNSYYGYGESFPESDIYKSLYLYWDLKGGVAYKFMKLTLGTSLRLNNVSKNGGTAKIGRPFYLMFSFVL
ncbi:MAG: VWA domain-containing protein [Bacteroidales bacterium]|nr:VWA domain-containing protein [Bacteroidales bacterium]